MEIVVSTDEEMQNLGKELSKILVDEDVVFLIGDLGAGKTTLVKGIAKGLGYAGNVTSPTFGLMNIYETSPRIYHFDFYRLESCEISDIGIEDYLQKDGIALIEWAEIGKSELPEEDYIINIDLTEDDYDKPRKVSIKANGVFNSQKLEELKKFVIAGSR